MPLPAGFLDRFPARYTTNNAPPELCRHYGNTDRISNHAGALAHDETMTITFGYR